MFQLIVRTKQYVTDLQLYYSSALEDIYYLWCEYFLGVANFVCYTKIQEDGRVQTGSMYMCISIKMKYENRHFSNNNKVQINGFL